MPRPRRELGRDSLHPMSDFTLIRHWGFRHLHQCSEWIDISIKIGSKYENLLNVDIAPVPSVCFNKRANLNMSDQEIPAVTFFLQNGFTKFHKTCYNLSFGFRVFQEKFKGLKKRQAFRSSPWWAPLFRFASRDTTWWWRQGRTGQPARYTWVQAQIS